MVCHGSSINLTCICVFSRVFKQNVIKNIQSSIKYYLFLQTNEKKLNNDMMSSKHIHPHSPSFTSLILQIFVLSGVIAMVTCAVFLRLNSLLKLAVLLLAVAVYSYLIHVAFLSLTRHDMLHRSVHSTS